ncbi:MAG TPA: NUDIX domain-containing protein, partial [Thermomicrobiales bacterium]|nr:NUDIX domain-containing protein [Thermomicrobiales bacterium]
QDELFDILDANGTPIGQVKSRGLVHRDGDWHRGLHVWVYGFNPHGVPFMLFQRRSMSKDTWPGMLDVAVGGHFSAGETLDETLRETEEEIGLKAAAADLTLLGRRFIEDIGDHYIDRELDEIYALRCDQPLHAYRMHPDEVDGLVTITLDDLHALFHESRHQVPARQLLRHQHETTITVSLSDFAGDRPGYRKAAVDGVRVLAAGQVPEPFDLRE